MDNNKHINIEALSDLCRLSLTDSEKNELEKDLESIIEFAKAVDSARSAAVDGQKNANVFRPDIPEEKKSIDYTNIAKVNDEEYFCVPKAVD